MLLSRRYAVGLEEVAKHALESDYDERPSHVGRTPIQLVPECVFEAVRRLRTEGCLQLCLRYL